MDFKAWHLIVIIIVAIIGYFGNQKYLKFFIKDIVKDIIEPFKECFNEMKEENKEVHSDIIRTVNDLNFKVTAHSATLNRYQDNESFFKSIEETIEEALRYLVNEEDAGKYIDSYGHKVIDFTKEIIRAGIEKIPDTAVHTKSNRYIIASKKYNKELFGSAFSKKYYANHLHVTTKYVADICKISEDKVNDKAKRFRSLTMVYVETVSTNFVNFYLNNKGLIK